MQILAWVEFFFVGRDLVNAEAWKSRVQEVHPLIAGKVCNHLQLNRNSLDFRQCFPQKINSWKKGD